jgi:aldose 1-epimerase
VLFALTSPDGDQGFPGNLQATAHYRLTDDNRIAISIAPPWINPAR